MRLSASSFAGTARTLVAVGSSSEACMFLAIAPAAPRSGLTVASSASSWDFAGVVDPAAGLVSVEESAERVAAEPLVPEDDDCCGEDVEGDGAAADAPLVGALPFAPPPCVADAGVLALPLPERVPPDEEPPDAEPPDEEPPDAEPPDDEPPDDEEDPADDTLPVDAPVEDAELAPAVFSPSAGA